ncbi:MAG: NADH-quinone oxidoreductase subunit NuoN [Rhodospirillales bacterium]
MTAMIPNLAAALPEAFLAVMIMAMLMLGVFQRAGAQDAAVDSFRLLTHIGLAVLALTAFLTVAAPEIPGGRMTAFGGMFLTDSFAVFIKVLVLAAAAFGLLMAGDYLERHGAARFEFPILIIFASLGMMMMVSANDLISLYMGLEMQSLALYIAAAVRREDQRSTEAGLKYFVLGALASGLLLYGMSLVYGFTGSTNFDAVAASLQSVGAGGEPPLGIIFGLVFIAAGLAFKISAAPFHMWTPDVYEGAPTPVTAFFAAAPKIAALALFMRVMFGPFGDLTESWRQIVVFLSVASMVLGAFAAVNQTNIKRLMAYSSIGHVGYALVGVAAGTFAGVQGVLIYLGIYLFMNAGTFACILCMKRGGRMVEEISDLAGFSKTHPLTALALAVFMFSMAGIPPLAGFFGKLYVFMAAVESGLYVLAVIGVVTSVVGAFYYLRIVKVMYFDSGEDALDKPSSKALQGVIGLSAVLVTFFFLFTGPLLDSAARAAAALFTG